MRKTCLPLALAVVLATGVVAPSTAEAQCQMTGVGTLTANYVNDVPSGPFVVTCDIGIFISQDGVLSGVEISGTVSDAKPVQYGIYVSGAAVTVTGSSVTVADGYPHQFVSVTYRDGATGTIRDSVFTGAHRAGVALRGVGTDVTVSRNTVRGTGAKTSGWAENGIQVDQGAVARITNNIVTGHWWDGPSNWASTGILLFSSNSHLSNNTMTDNEFSVFVAGSDNHVSGNQTSSTIVSQSIYNFRAWGVLIAGDRNHLAGNRVSADDGAGGVYIYPGSTATRITGNRITGFEAPIIDGGTGTVARGNTSPTS
ncbi:MAG: right-handed parallel beta-helix repeat-containing protein [Vicinamibacterales bacterium]|nr:right-handed parallel beta-helix repeat-containing protein [Vicinamibacterales bacterium]